MYNVRYAYINLRACYLCICKCRACVNVYACVIICMFRKVKHMQTHMNKMYMICDMHVHVNVHPPVYVYMHACIRGCIACMCAKYMHMYFSYTWRKQTIWKYLLKMMPELFWCWHFGGLKKTNYYKILKVWNSHLRKPT